MNLRTVFLNQVGRLLSGWRLMLFVLAFIVRTVFLNQVGRLRSGWRLMLFVLAFIAISLLLSTILRVAYAILWARVPPLPHASFIAEVVFRVSLILTALAAGYLCARLLEGLPWKSLGLTLHEGCFRDLLVGSMIGIASLALSVGIAFAAGGLRFAISDSGIVLSVGRSLLSSGVLLFVAALAEEAMFRGYPLQTLTRARLAWLAVLLTSLPFAAVHLSNPNATPFAFANTAIAGLWLAVTYLRTRSLWLPWGVHWGWNWALGSLFGLPISGMDIVSHPLFSGRDLGPTWLTGGSYGIEGGAAGTLALVVSTVFVWKTSWLTATPELKKLTSEENPAIASRVMSLRPADD